jgi:hypothetical protein
VHEGLNRWGSARPWRPAGATTPSGAACVAIRR